MQEQIISFEVAKLAKEKGFDVKTKFFYDKDWFRAAWIQSDSSLKNYNNPEISKEQNKEIISCPTQSLLQKWLREIHNTDIQILRNKPGYDEYSCEIYKTNINGSGNYFHTFIKENNSEYIKWFKTYEEALECGLLESLKLINI